MSRVDIVIHEMLNEWVGMISLYMRCSMNESRWCGYTWDVKRVSRDDIVIHEILNEWVEMISLYMRY
jgi:hypothetical protein